MIAHRLNCFFCQSENGVPTSEEYRRHAEETRKHAAKTQDLWEREALLRMAAQWERLADHKARKEAER